MLGILSKSDAKFNISCQNYAIHEGVSYDADIKNKDCTTFFIFRLPVALFQNFHTFCETEQNVYQ